MNRLLIPLFLVLWVVLLPVALKLPWAQDDGVWTAMWMSAVLVFGVVRGLLMYRKKTSGPPKTPRHHEDFDEPV